MFLFIIVVSDVILYFTNCQNILYVFAWICLITLASNIASSLMIYVLVDFVIISLQHHAVRYCDDVIQLKPLLISLT